MDALCRSPVPTHGPSARYVRAVAAILLCGAVPSCGANDASSFAPPSPSAAGGSPGQVEVSIRFDSDGPLVLGPREAREIKVVVSPPTARDVRFALLNAHDAALDRSAVVTDTKGQASVGLTAPSSLVSFTLQAFVGGAVASLPAVVRSPNSTRVEVVPVYSGSRKVEEWVASVHPERTCAGFGPVPRDDSKHFSRIAADQSASIGPVAPFPEFAVTLRAGQYVGGCTDVKDWAPSKELRISVIGLDNPIDLEASDLDVALGVPAQDPAFSRAVEQGLAALREAFRSGADTDATALLDAMESELGRAARRELQAARAGSDLDGALTAHARVGRSGLSDTLNEWVRVGQSALFSPRAFEGSLSADPEGTRGVPSFVLERVGQLAAADLDAQVTRTTWSADRSDTLAFGATISFQHAALLAGLAAAPGRAATGALDGPTALAKAADCAAIAKVLEEAALRESIELSASCDSSCLATACAGAVATLWNRAATQDLEATLTLTAVGHAEVGNRAQVIEVPSGEWVGRLALLEAVDETDGSVRADAPRYSAR